MKKYLLQIVALLIINSSYAQVNLPAYQAINTSIPIVNLNPSGPGKFSQTYTYSQSPTAASETAFNTFRASLTGSYTTFKIYNDLNPTGITVTDAVKVPLIAAAIRTATAGSWTIGSYTWRVELNCGSPSIADKTSVVFTNSTNGCSCNTGAIYTIRPDIGNYNWGGVGGECSQPTQTLTLWFY